MDSSTALADTPAPKLDADGRTVSGLDYDALVEEARLMGEIFAAVSQDGASVRGFISETYEKRHTLSYDTLQTVSRAVAELGIQQAAFGANASRDDAIYIGGVLAGLSRVSQIVDFLSGDASA